MMRIQVTFKIFVLKVHFCQTTNMYLVSSSWVVLAGLLHMEAGHLSSVEIQKGYFLTLPGLSTGKH